MPKINLSGFINLEQNQKFQELQKSAQEGVYADTPENKKLGRVGMSYKGEKKQEKKEHPIRQKMLDDLKSGPKAFKSLNYNDNDMTNNYHINQLVKSGKVHTKGGVYALKEHSLEGNTVKNAKNDRTTKHLKENISRLETLVKQGNEWLKKLSPKQKDFLESLKKSSNYDERKKIEKKYMDKYGEDSKIPTFWGEESTNYFNISRNYDDVVENYPKELAQYKKRLANAEAKK